jgi:BirA family biotin operon repressor/biotin-[acetyl-CoA-carboxylase] ligase
MERAILEKLSADYPWAALLHTYSTVDSTNTQAKLLAKNGAPHGTVLVADTQTGGRGRLGRSFHSPGGAGIYLSVILRPDCTPDRLMHLTCAAGVAVCDAIENALGIRPGIKWTNDLVWNRHKLGGILTELSLDAAGHVDYAVVGIGLNCCQSPQDFPPELRDMAISLQHAAGKEIAPSLLAAHMILALSRMDLSIPARAAVMGAYRRDCITLGQQVRLVRGEESAEGMALDVDEEGALLVRFRDGSIRPVSSGEVSVRGMYGYL